MSLSDMNKIYWVSMGIGYSFLLQNDHFTRICSSSLIRGTLALDEGKYRVGGVFSRISTADCGA